MRMFEILLLSFSMSGENMYGGLKVIFSPVLGFIMNTGEEMFGADWGGRVSSVILGNMSSETGGEDSPFGILRKIVDDSASEFLVR